MLMHSCWSIVFNMLSGFDLNSKGSKNHLEMELENLFGKRKGNTFPSPSLLQFCPAGPLLPRASLLALLPFPSVGPAQSGWQPLLPCLLPSRPLTAWPRPSEPSPTSARPAPAPSHDATAAPTPRRGSVSPRAPCLYKKGAEPFPAPPAASPRSLSRRPCPSNRRARIAVVLRPLLTVVRRPRFIPASDFRPW